MKNKVGLTKFNLKWLQNQKEKVRVKLGDPQVLIGWQNDLLIACN